MRISLWQCGVVFCIATGLLSGCHDGQNIPGYTVATGGSAQRGQQVIAQFNCGKCHTIPGIHDANGVVGPPLNFIARRSIIAGNFPNEPNYLVQWIRTPEQMKPKTAMPDLGLTEQQARDAAAYLYTLQ